MASSTDQPGLDEPGLGGGTGTLLEQEVESTPRTSHSDGDHDRFAHYVPKEKLMQALVEGMPVRALCGKMWTPSRDPSRYPVCPECKEIWESKPERPKEPTD